MSNGDDKDLDSVLSDLDSDEPARDEKSKTMELKMVAQPSLLMDQLNLVVVLMEIVQNKQICLIRSLCLQKQIWRRAFEHSSRLQAIFLFIIWALCLQMYVLKEELEEAKKAIVESKKNLNFKEATAAAAMCARDAVERDLRLADNRAIKLKRKTRYVCWPWQLLGIAFVGGRKVESEQQQQQKQQEQQQEQSSNEMELAEPKTRYYCL
ncbi:unnamed protein product [Cochlearia groenlandica]